MKVVFRTDASLQIGTGHVMRCLTLADALKAERDADTLFLCRDHAGHLADVIRQRGHRVALLPAAHPQNVTSVSPSAYSEPTHASWLGTDWETDARQTGYGLDHEALVNWLVVDHYALDARWERAMRARCRRLMVIDDLADRFHDCDLLLDQNLGRHTDDYAELVPSGCKVLVGTAYALLRPEFARLRAASLVRRKTARLQHLLISMGGVDKDNTTGAVLLALQPADLPSDCHITVVIGAHAPHLTAVKALSAQMLWRTEVLVNVQDMASLMADSDLAIGAAGTTSWERCCLGLPAVLLILAENQWLGANALESAGAALLLGKPPAISCGLSRVIANARRSLTALMQAASDVSTGHGTGLVCNEIWSLNVS